MVIAVGKAVPFSVTATPDQATVTAGEKFKFKVKVERAKDWTENVQMSGFDLPNNAVVPLVTVAKGSTEGDVEVTLPANLRPGLYTFTINGAGQVPRDYAKPDANKSRSNNIRVVYPSNPITITVIGATKSK